MTLSNQTQKGKGPHAGDPFQLSDNEKSPFCQH